MKRVITVLLTLILIISSSACGSVQSESTPKSTIPISLSRAIDVARGSYVLKNAIQNEFGVQSGNVELTTTDDFESIDPTDGSRPYWQMTMSGFISYSKYGYQITDSFECEVAVYDENTLKVISVSKKSG